MSQTIVLMVKIVLTGIPYTKAQFVTSFRHSISTFHGRRGCQFQIAEY